MSTHHCNSKKVEDLVSKLPEDVRDLGEEVLHAINCGKKLVGWNGNEELTIDGASVPNTNILKLVKYILYPEDKHLKVPNGFNTFIEGLKTVGLESEWVRNESVKQVLDNNENDWDTTDESDSEEEDDGDKERDDGDKEDDEGEKEEEEEEDEESLKSDEESGGQGPDVENSDSDVEMDHKHSKIEWKNLSSGEED